MLVFTVIHSGLILLKKFTPWIGIDSIIFDILSVCSVDFNIAMAVNAYFALAFGQKRACMDAKTNESILYCQFLASFALFIRCSYKIIEVQKMASNLAH